MTSDPIHATPRREFASVILGARAVAKATKYSPYRVQFWVPIVADAKLHDRMLPEANPLDHRTIVAQTEAWLARVVIGLNLCPFAKAVQSRGQIRYVVNAATDEAGLLVALLDELDHLARADPIRVDTTLLIHPWVLNEFPDFNQFLGAADDALVQAGYGGAFQLASFHPRYRFSGSTPDDIANASNRSPYPMLHLLREASVDRAVAAFPDAAAIFERNIDTLRTLGPHAWAQLMRECRGATPATRAATRKPSKPPR